MFWHAVAQFLNSFINIIFLKQKTESVSKDNQKFNSAIDML